MVAGFHLIFTAYGWWLPNDPRGSNSHEIRVEQIADLGELHFGRKLIQPPRAYASPSLHFTAGTEDFFEKLRVQGRCQPFAGHALFARMLFQQRQR